MANLPWNMANTYSGICVDMMVSSIPCSMKYLLSHPAKPPRMLGPKLSE